MGPHTRLEFQREDGRYVAVELTRAALRLRERLGIQPGTRVHLKPRRVTRFVAGDADLRDPAAAI